MSEKKLISFIIPARNSSQTIKATIESIRSQETKLTYDLIVVDNASSDNTIDICHSLNVKVIKEERVGRAYARNRGIKESNSEWLCFIDSDVILNSQWLASFENPLKEGFFDVLQGKTFPAGKKLQFLNQYREELFKFQYDGYYSSLDRLQFTAPLCNTSSCLIKREFLERVNFFDEQFVNTEDVDLSWSLWKEGAKFCVVKEAISNVFFEGGLFSYLKRSFDMGGGSSKLMKKWGYKTSRGISFQFKKYHFSKVSFKLFNYLNQIIFALGFLLDFKPVQNKKKTFHDGNYKALTEIRSKDSFLVLTPFLRLLQSSHSLVIRDLRNYQKISLSIDDSNYSEEDVFRRITTELSSEKLNSIAILHQK